MFVRTLAELEAAGRIKSLAGGTARSARFLTAADDMGFSYNDNRAGAGTDVTLWYKNHWEANYIVSGRGEITDLATGVRWPMEADVLYVVGPNDRHRFRILEDEHLISVFCPPLRGDEGHDADGSYTASGPAPKTSRRMFMRRADEMRAAGKEMVVANGAARTLRMLTQADDVGFGLSDVHLEPGAETVLWYKHHREANHILAGTGEVTDLSTGESWRLEPGVAYNVGPRYRHKLRAITGLHLLSIFSPALQGDEQHDPEGTLAPQPSDLTESLMKCVVIGGGVVGASIAWHLARRGVGDVLLLERDRLGSGTTWHSAGNITWKPSHSHDAPILYALETLSRLKAETGQETGWTQTGRMFIAQSVETRRNFEAFDRAAQERGIKARWIEPREAATLNPLLDPSAVEAIWLNSVSGRTNPADFTAAYAAAARLSGATIDETVEVSGISVAGGRVTGAETNNGSIPADAVVVASGLWSRPLLEPLGIALAQWACEHFYVIADVSPQLARETPSFVAPDDLLYGREEVGRFMVGCFDENAKPLDPASLPKPFSFTLLAPDWDKIAPYFERAIRLFPALGTAPIRHFVNGPESFTPDGLPLIGRVGGIDGLLVATAMNSAGVTWSAMTGAMIADLVADTSPHFDPRPYDPARFGDRGRDLDWLKSQVSAIVSQGYRNQNR